MKERYNKTNWVDNKTPVNAENLNNIENGLENIYNNTLSPSEFLEGPGINLGYSRSGLKISLSFREVETAPVSKNSEGMTGDYYIDNDLGFIYFYINGSWIKLKLEAF